MIPRISRIISASIRSGPRAVILTRGAKKRGAAQKTREFAAFVSMLRKRELGVIVEIGTLHGGTLWAWCSLARRDALIVSIDLPGGAFGGGYEIGKAATLQGYARRKQVVALIRDDSHEERTRVALERVLEGRDIDLLFIDGDHSCEGVKRDFTMYSPLVCRDGVIALHDILHHPADPDCRVDVFWEQLRATRRHIEYVDPADTRGRGQWGGIGVVFGENPTASPWWLSRGCRGAQA